MFFMDYFAIWRYFGWAFGILPLGSLALEQWGIWRGLFKILQKYRILFGSSVEPIPSIFKKVVANPNQIMGSSMTRLWLSRVMSFTICLARNTADMELYHILNRYFIS